MHTSNESCKKRIAMFSIHGDPLAALGSQQNGGQNAFVYFLSKFLDQKGYCVDVYTHWDNSKKKEVVYIDEKSRVIRLKGGPIAPIDKYDLPKVFPELYENFQKFLHKDNTPSYDFFHGHYWDGGWMAMRAAQEFKKPFFENFHSLGQTRLKTIKQYEMDTKIRNNFDARFKLEQEIIASANAVISLAETEKRDLMELYGAPSDKIHVIRGGVDLRRFSTIPKAEAREKLKLPNDEFIILFVGRLEWRKGAATAIKAVSLLKEAGKETTLMIVGGKIHGPEKDPADIREYERLLQRAKDEGVESRVVFEGRADQTQLHLYYSAADVFVVPSYYEPFGLVALEGMACKVPVVASRKGGLRITIKDGETGLLFEPRNPYDLRDKILILYQSAELRDKLVAAAYQSVKKDFSWQSIANEYINLYENCAPRSR
ncbi:MAG: glycosyltransferase [bacterium]|nr:glycosyltransferase [bacterium]